MIQRTSGHSVTCDFCGATAGTRGTEDEAEASARDLGFAIIDPGPHHIRRHLCVTCTDATRRTIGPLEPVNPGVPYR